MPELAGLSHVSWMDYCRTKIRVGKKKQEACHDPQCNIWVKCRMAMYHISGRDHYRHSDRFQHFASPYVLPLKLRR